MESVYEYGGQIYGEHIVWQLRPGRGCAEPTKHKFATRTLCLDITYSNLMRLHFWVEIVLISNLMPVSKPAVG